jgi:hypothetical protein
LNPFRLRHGEAERRAAERAYYATFRPHLRAETERRVSEPLHVAGMVNPVQLRLVSLPREVWRADAIARDRIVGKAIRRHYRRRKGQAPTCGKIVGYALILAPGVLCDLALPYDVDGNRAGSMRAVHRLGSAMMTMTDRWSGAWSSNHAYPFDIQSE